MYKYRADEFRSLQNDKICSYPCPDELGDPHQQPLQQMNLSRQQKIPRATMLLVKFITFV